MQDESVPVGLEEERPAERSAASVAIGFTAAGLLAFLLLLAANWTLYNLKVGIGLGVSHLGVILAGTGIGLLGLCPALLVTGLFCAIPWKRIFAGTAGDPLRMRSLRFFLLAAFAAGALWGIECVLPRWVHPEKAADLAWSSRTVPSSEGGYTESYSNPAARALSFLAWEAFFILLTLFSVVRAVVDAGRSTRREGFGRRGIGFIPHAASLLLCLAFVNLALAKAAPVIREADIVRNLASPDREAALDAAARLGPGHARAARTLVAGLEDPDPAIRIRSAEILGAQKRNDLQALVWSLFLDGDPRVRKAAASAVAAAGGPVTDLMLRRIGAAVRERKAAGVPLESEVVDLFTGALKDDEWKRKEDILDFLAEAPTADPARDLRPALEGASREAGHRSSTVRHKALPVLARIGDPSSAPQLAASLGWCENTRAREAVMESLSRMRGPAVDPLIAALKDGKACDFAATVLSRIGDPRAAVPMARAFMESFAGEKTLDALKAMGRPAVDALKAAARDHAEAEGRRAALQALLALQAPGVIDLLAGAAGDPDPKVREEAVTGLARMKGPRVASALAAAMAGLKEEDRNLRRRIVGALDEFDDPAAIQALIGALTDADRTVRNLAAFGLGKLKAAGAVDALIAALGDADALAASAASTALSKIGRPAFGPLVRALGHESAAVRAGAAKALRRAAKNPLPGDDIENWKQWLEGLDRGGAERP